jgi:tetratricopeptide (TPR) repeat protein
VTATESRVDLDALAHLEEQRDFLLRSLQDLEREHAAGDIDEADYVTLKDDYTARAAAVIRAIDEGQAALVAARPQRGSSAARRRTRAIAVATIAVVALGVLAGVLVAGSSGQRVAGQQVSGSIGGSGNSDLTRAHLLDQQGQALEALQAYDQVLKPDPKNVEALTYRGWLLARTSASAGAAAESLLQRAEQSLEQAIAIDPSYPEAHVFRGIVLFRYRGQPAQAVIEFQLVLSGNPPADVRQLVQGELQQALDATKAGTTTTTTG